MGTSDTYFDTLGQAIETAKEKARADGYEVVENDMLLEACGYGQSQHYRFELTRFDKKTGMQKLQKRMLQIAIVRMDTGSYELTSYVM